MIGGPHICLVNPPLISQKNDPHTGIIFMPFMLAALSAYLKREGYPVQVVDAFGAAPERFADFGPNQIQGLPIAEAVARIDPRANVVVFHFGGVVAYRGIVEMLRLCRAANPGRKYALLENAQAVTAISLRSKAAELLALGFDYLMCGDPEPACSALLRGLAGGNSEPEIPGLLYLRADGSVCDAGQPVDLDNLDELPIADWDAFPLDSYWDIGYAHGPMQGRYLPLLTSRGCPVPCRFCVIPQTNARRWRARSAASVVDEMEFWQRRLGVSEFHIEDVNATVRNDRIVEICRLIVQRGLRLKWKFVAGTKIETMKLETIPLLAQAGCNYVSFSPETGSPGLLKLMDKPFRHSLALDMVRSMHRLGIFSQACFVLGFPGETIQDARQTRTYVRQLTRAGLDEIAQFIITPIPGSAIFDQFSGYSDYTQLTFSPTWRADFATLRRRRFTLYVEFAIWKVLFHPLKVARQVFNILRGRFETKMEQALYRITVFRLRGWFGMHPPTRR